MFKWQYGIIIVISMIQVAVNCSMIKIQEYPSPSQPFVFIHIEKTAGTTIREHIHKAAVLNSYGHIIPCVDNISCVIFAIEDNPRVFTNGSKMFPTIVQQQDLSNVSVLAGHFQWDVWNSLPAHNFRKAEMLNSSRDKMERLEILQSVPACFVSMRHPISRFISYYYQRCFFTPSCKGHNRLINNLTLDEIQYLVLHDRQAVRMGSNQGVVVDEGASNAVCRTLSGKRHTSGSVFDMSETFYLPIIYDEEARDLAIENIGKCVVGIVERWSETLHSMSHYFPWLNPINNTLHRSKNVINEAETMQTLRADLYDVVAAANTCDMQLYQHSVAIFEQQLLATLPQQECPQSLS